MLIAVVDVLKRALELRESGQRAVLVTVVGIAGSTPRKLGARMLVRADGQIEGTIGGGRVEEAVRAEALEVIEAGQSIIRRYELTHELAMCCGGKMSFLIEPIGPEATLIVMGCGHVGRAIIAAAARVDFRIVVVDDLESNLEQLDEELVAEIIDSFDRHTIDALPFGISTYVVIATREHALDQALLERCLEQPHCYLGVIGSERKAQMQRKRLLAKGFSPEVVESVRCPMGLDIAAETPAEIAVSVTAELVQTRRSQMSEETGHGVTSLVTEKTGA